MRWLCPFIVSLSLACGARYRHETLGTTRAVAERSPSAAIAIANAGDRHVARVAFHLPRAVMVRYRIECPGEDVSADVGETWEHYERRRRVELERQRQQKVAAVGSLVGAVTGEATAHGQVETPAGEAEGTVTVDGRVVGEEVAEGAIAKVTLPPGDVGAQQHKVRHTLWPKAPGPCSLTFWSELPAQDLSGVVADMRIERLVDLREERSAALAVVRGRALDVRGKLVASLVAGGADPNHLRDVRLRQQEAAARLRSERLRLRRLRIQQQQASDRAKRAGELRVSVARAAVRRGALSVRGRLVLSLVAGGANPHRQRDERLRREQIAVRLRNERLAADRLRNERIRRERLVAERLRNERLREREATARLRRERSEEKRRREHARRAGQLRVLAAARAVRLRVEGVLVGSGCTPHRREHERRQARFRAAMSLRWARDVRGTVVAQLIASGSDPEYRRKRFEAELRGHAVERARLSREAALRAAHDQVKLDAALRMRADLKLALISSGAVDRPPRPAAPLVRRPPVPYSTAVWVSGHYEWSVASFQWVWTPGYWTQPPSLGLEWLPAVEVVVGGIRVTRPGRWRPSGGVEVREHD